MANGTTTTVKKKKKRERERGEVKKKKRTKRERQMHTTLRPKKKKKQAKRGVPHCSKNTMSGLKKKKRKPHIFKLKTKTSSEKKAMG